MAMRIQHLNCGSLNPRLSRVQATIYCLLVETNQGLVLIDTGFGMGNYEHPSMRMRGGFWFMGVPRLMEETALHQVASLGFQRKDVRDIVLTHLHLDHAEGLPDFPHTRVHIHRRELAAARRPRWPVDLAYDHRHWSHGPQWVPHRRAGRQMFGFEAIPIREDLGPEIPMLPLHGYTRGHCGVAVRTGRGWPLHCGDAASAFHAASNLHDNDESRHLASILPEGFVARFLGSQVPRLRLLLAENGETVQMISAHDVYSLARLTHSDSVNVYHGATSA